MKVFVINPGMVNDYVYNELCSELQKQKRLLYPCLGHLITSLGASVLKILTTIIILLT